MSGPNRDEPSVRKAAVLPAEGEARAGAPAQPQAPAVTRAPSLPVPRRIGGSEGDVLVIAPLDLPPGGLDVVEARGLARLKRDHVVRGSFGKLALAVFFAGANARTMTVTNNCGFTIW